MCIEKSVALSFTTKKKMNFSDLIEFLAKIARGIEEPNTYLIELNVFDRDLTDDDAYMTLRFDKDHLETLIEDYDDSFIKLTTCHDKS